MKKEVELTKKQAEFVRNYIISMNATDAAKKAGYSEKTAYAIGSENLKKPEIKKAIQEELNALHCIQKNTFIQAANDAIKALVDVVKNGRGLPRVQAANSILDRAGHKPVDHVKTDLNANVDANITVSDARNALLTKLIGHSPEETGTPSN